MKVLSLIASLMLSCQVIALDWEMKLSELVTTKTLDFKTKYSMDRLRVTIASEPQAHADAIFYVVIDRSEAGIGGRRILTTIDSSIANDLEVSQKGDVLELKYKYLLQQADGTLKTIYQSSCYQEQVSLAFAKVKCP